MKAYRVIELRTGLEHMVDANSARQALEKALKQWADARSDYAFQESKTYLYAVNLSDDRDTFGVHKD